MADDFRQTRNKDQGGFYDIGRNELIDRQVDRIKRSNIFIDKIIVERVPAAEILDRLPDLFLNHRFDYRERDLAGLEEKRAYWCVRTVPLLLHHIQQFSIGQHFLFYQKIADSKRLRGER